MTNRIGDIQPLIQEYQSKSSANESEIVTKVIAEYEQLLHLFKQKNDMINQIWDVHENEKYQLAQETLDPLEQILYSSLLGIRALDQEAQSPSTKEYLATLKKEIERQLYEVKKASISVYPICMQDLGPFGAVKSLYELLKEGNKIVIDIDFKGSLNRNSQKVEIQIFRFTQYFIRIIENLKTVASMIVRAEEKEGQVTLIFEGKNLLQQLQQSSEYRLFKELADSIDGVKIKEQNENEISVVFNKENN